MLYSISCQAICDTYGQFTTVKTKWPCSEHDACNFAIVMHRKVTPQANLSCFTDSYYLVTRR